MLKHSLFAALIGLAFAGSRPWWRPASWPAWPAFPDRPSSARRGHSPRPGCGLALKPADGLKALYAKLDPNKETIVYCQSGVRAAETATVLKDLGFKKVKVYDSSWLGYGNTLDAPAENAQFFNVGALNARLAAMQKRIDALEKALAEARPAR